MKRRVRTLLAVHMCVCVYNACLSKWGVSGRDRSRRRSSRSSTTSLVQPEKRETVSWFYVCWLLAASVLHEAAEGAAVLDGRLDDRRLHAERAVLVHRRDALLLRSALALRSANTKPERFFCVSKFFFFFFFN